MQSMKSTFSARIEILKDSHLAQVLGVIGSVRGEFGLSHRVPSLLEPADLNLLDVYQHPRSCYFVATIDNNRVLGGAGIFPLAGADSVTCELQRMYLCFTDAMAFETSEPPSDRRITGTTTTGCCSK
jgi:hypothetical protein